MFDLAETREGGFESTRRSKLGVMWPYGSYLLALGIHGRSRACGSHGHEWAEWTAKRATV